MPFASLTTAEHVMGAVEALIVNGAPANLAFVAEYLDTTATNATAALEMGIELGFSPKTTEFILRSTHCVGSLQLRRRKSPYYGSLSRDIVRSQYSENGYWRPLT